MNKDKQKVSNMKNYKYFFYCLVAVSSLLLGACSKDDDVEEDVAGLEVSATTLRLAEGADATETASFTVKGTSKWTLTSYASWLQFCPASGEGEQVITVTARLNSQKEDRIGWIYVDMTDSQGKSYREQVRVQQGPGEYYIIKQNGTFNVNGVTFKVVNVSGGTFKMGSNTSSDPLAQESESPAHVVTISGYYIGESEVTQELWETVMGSNPSTVQGKKLPVESVSWDDCQEFLAKLNSLTGLWFRLPTEAEWEFAARGGLKSHDYTYSGSNTINDVAWYGDNSGGVPHEVMSKQPNELGIYDMSGNVWEWCSDWYGPTYYSQESGTEPTGPESGSKKVQRGGRFNGGAVESRVTRRNSLEPHYETRTVGLRIAL